MRDIPASLAGALASGVTTLARCCKVTRGDGESLGFTDHDEDLEFGDVTFRAASGMTASAAEASLGLAVDGLEVAGALDSEALSEEALARGAFDGAKVELWLVDWSAPSSRLLLFSGALGEVARGRGVFTAELRGLTHALSQPRGRLYQRACDADLGDARCKVDLTASENRATGEVQAALGPRIFGTRDYDGPAGRFERGRLVWTSGGNAGSVGEIRRQVDDRIELAEAPAVPIAEGDAFLVTAGCDKTWRACRDRFDNALNFRGFPDIPGNDWLALPARSGPDNDGGRRG
ncbi:DUF2163 domain-containing protein [Methylopila sp. M107]|uniref:DUF2163 domain-containing protein n=1 Tax=Methylopila sp. M107 TaxID=1101190 RepID=UPI00037C2D45|nr:DUF2163 domain-containing protein [Methylopila sp. M107]